MQDLPVKRTQRAHVLLTTLLIVTCLVAVGASVFFYTKYRSSQDTEQARQQKLVAQLSEVLELPKESPTVVTVSDKDKLTNRSLAERVKNNDLLLIYAPAKRIVIYRPSTEKVVDMLTYDAQQAKQAEQSQSKSK